MRINIRLVRGSQYLHQFRLLMRHKSGKEYIILDALSKLAGAKNTTHNNKYSELDSLFVYHITLVEINLNLVKHILDGYVSDSW